MSGIPLAPVGAWAVRTTLAVVLGAAGVGAVHAETLPPEEAPPPTEAPQRHLDAERLALSLLDCTRGGGWVRADGSCKVRDSATVSPPLQPLRLHDGISRKVAFRWAGAMARAAVCDHVIPGKPVLSARLSVAGYRYRVFGENVGCNWGSMPALDMVIWTHRAMQAEERYRGGHWRNIMSASYRSVGIGVASMDGRTTIVYDFYGR